VLSIIAKVFALLFALYQLVNVVHPLQTAELNQNTHLAFALVLIFVNRLAINKKGIAVYIILLLFSLVSTVYVQIFYEQLLNREWLPIKSDVIVGIMLIIAVFEAVRQRFGLVLPVIAGLFILYLIFGHYLPHPLKAYEINQIIRIPHMLSTGLSGIYGTLLNVSASYLVLFFLFAGLIQATGATTFFQEVAKLISRRVRSGAALGAVVTSGLIGSVTGSAGPNVAITGSFTIPMMKKAGYPPHQAGAIEATASTGGQIMPPIMGAAAFVMSAFTGISYWDICVACFLPAILYFLSIGLYAHFQAVAMGIQKTEAAVDVRALLTNLPLFVIPLGVIVYRLMLRYSPGYSIFWAIVVLVGISLFKKDNRELSRRNLNRWTDAILRGMLLGSAVAVACALLGIMVHVVSVTGLGLKLPLLIREVSGGRLYVALPLIMAASFLLGCGITSMAVYVLVAVLTAPLLVELGLLTLQAHLFVYFYAILAQISLPVATAALVAAPLAGAGYLKTGLNAMKAGIGLFVIPFFFIWAPPLIGVHESFGISIISVISCVLVLVVVQALINWQYIAKPTPLEGALLSLCLVLLLGGLITKSPTLSGVGGAVLAIVSFMMLRRKGIILLKMPKKKNVLG
jgi:TRAP transporter 4TM/12TM fusion protein